MRILLVALVLFIPQQKSRVDEMVAGVDETRLKKTLEKLVSFETRSSVSDATSDKRGIGAARAWIKSEFETIAKSSKSEMTVSYHDFSIKVRGQEVAQKNVYALLKGKKHPKRVVVFGGHYDSINLKDKDPNATAPGANDDGSGTAAVLEAARLFSKYEFENSVIFVAFSSEEQGLFGSKAFADFLKKSDFEVVAMLNNDIVGGVDDAKEGVNEKDCRCFSDPKHDASRQFARWAKLVAESRVKDFVLKLQDAADRPGRGGDHQSFNKAGFTAIRLIESYENLEHQHSPTDTLDHVRLAYLRKMAQVDVALVATLANAPPTPEGIEAAGDSEKVVLKWKAVPGAAGYRVAVRKGGLEFVEVVATKETSRTIPKGDVEIQIGVAAEGPDGELSLFTTEVRASK